MRKPLLPAGFLMFCFCVACVLFCSAVNLLVAGFNRFGMGIDVPLIRFYSGLNVMAAQPIPI
jgi:hypothetical protein